MPQKTDNSIVCHWCKEPIRGHGPMNKTTPQFSDWPQLSAGTGVVVCGENCPARPVGAPVGARFESV